jgi:hypothetical protein
MREIQMKYKNPTVRDADSIFIDIANSRSRSYCLLRFVIGPVGSKQVISVDTRAACTTSNQAIETQQPLF